jgi:hypothetical protein
MPSSLGKSFQSGLSILLFAFLFVAQGGAFAFADDAHIINVVKADSVDRVIVSATLKGAFTPEIRKSIDSGGPVTFTYHIQLKRLRGLIWDKTVYKFTLKKMVKFDALKKEYLAWEKKDEDEDDIDFKAELENVHFNKAGDVSEVTTTQEEEIVMEPLIFKKVSELEKWMTHIEKFDLGSTKGLDASAFYKARVRCKMKQLKLIPPFNYILFFMSFLDFDTEWTNSTTFSINVCSDPLKNSSSELDKTKTK